MNNEINPYFFLFFDRILSAMLYYLKVNGNLALEETIF
jgi:hypothetical protein